MSRAGHLTHMKTRRALAGANRANVSTIFQQDETGLKISAPPTLVHLRVSVAVRNERED